MDLQHSGRAPRLGMLALGLALAPDPARAEAPALAGGIDAHGFQLAAFDGDVRDGLLLVRPGAFEAGSWWAGALFERAEAPLVWVPVTEDGAGSPEPLLDDLYAMNVSFGGAVHQRVRFDVALPVYLASTGADGQPQGADLGDARFTTLLALVRPDGGGLGLGLAPWVDLPVGARDSFLGQSGVGGGGLLTGTWERTHLTVDAELGFAWMPALDVENLTGSDRAIAGLGLGWAWGDGLGATVEARASLPTDPGEIASAERPAELLASLRGQGEAGAHWTVGGASALSRGASAAAWRVFVGGGFGRRAPAVRDLDIDGALDILDACPGEAEVPNGYQDEDGCPDQLGTLRVRVERGGSPVAADLTVQSGGAEQRLRSEDGTAVFEGLRPDTLWTVRALAGRCLAAEAELRGAPGAQDLELRLAPSRPARLRFSVQGEAGEPLTGVEVRVESDDPDCVPAGLLALDGDGRGEVATGAGPQRITLQHPTHLPWQASLDLAPGDEATFNARMLTARARVQGRAIVILDRVYFEPGRADLAPESHELLDQVARVLAGYPELTRVEVAGHTDDGGPDDYNLDLSTRRAEAVRNWLIGQGIAAERLVAHGYGEAQPIDTNTEEEGRATNRRVEFNILVREEQ